MPNPVFSSLPTSIFQHMTGLALKHDALNLGQGFPDQDGPLSLREVAARQLIEGPNQYPPSKGLPILRQAVAAPCPQILWPGYDPEDEVVITSGGTEAVTGALMAMAVAGDEVVMIEPTYDSYRPMAEGRRRGGQGGQAGAARLAADGRGLARRDRTQDPRHPDQLAAQSGGPRLQPRRAGDPGAGGVRTPTRW